VFEGVFFSAGKVSIRENGSLTTDLGSGATWSATTGEVVLDPLRKTILTEIQIVLTGSGQTTLFVDYSTDGGSTWKLYGASTVTLSGVSSYVKISKLLEATRVRLRFRGASLAPIRISGVYVYAAAGGMIRP
jgi:hypothetical protein